MDFGIVGRFDDTQRYLVTDYMVGFATSDFKKVVWPATQYRYIHGWSDTPHRHRHQPNQVVNKVDKPMEWIKSTKKRAGAG